MSIDQVILELLQQIPSSKFFQNTRPTRLQINQDELLVITKSDIQILGHSVEEKIQVDSQTTTLNIENAVDFLSALWPHTLRLDHLGVSYYAEHIEEEIRRYKQLLVGTDLKWYIENSGDSNQEWVFIGNKSIWEAPLVEVVLTRKNYLAYDAWIPHFQIDIDTTLDIEEINEMIEKYFGKEITKWDLPIKGVGIVLTMIVLGEVNGTKIALGIGTKLRNTQFHRENILKEG